jgi:hypothetical protein
MARRVEMRHLRALNYCARGSRKFFERHGFDWADFLRNGIEPDKFYKTGDSMAIKAAQLAESES